MDKRTLRTMVAAVVLAPGLAGAQEAVQYKVIRTQEFINTPNPKPGERVRIAILTGNEKAGNFNGIWASIPPAKPGDKPAYHYHKFRESIIQILSGDATEMVAGKAVPLKPGDVIFIPPNIKHTMVNNSTTQDVKYMEFYSPIAVDTVQVTE